MARPQTSARSSAEGPNGGVERRSPETPARPKESWRDTLESIVFAFVLAFLFRTFEAEAFVIPTGSMAPTLYGRHKECQCEKCSFPIVIGASDEVDPDLGYLRWAVDEQGQYSRGPRIKSAVCPNCGFENRGLESELAFNGDRILVNKYPYEFGDPDRFDVFVFKWPEKPETNYIKRLIGLPNETIRIKQGDVYLWDPNAPEAEQILRKAPDKQRSLQLEVYNDAHPPREMLAANWPERWHGMQQAAAGTLGNWSDAATWQQHAENRSYSVPSSEELQWLRYRHYAPMPEDWEALGQGAALEPKARLISDFCGYNAYTGEGLGGDSDNVRRIDYGPFWVSDLTVHFDLQLESVAPSAELLLELVDGASTYRCRLDPATGKAVLTAGRAAGDGLDETELATAATPITGPGSYSVAFANVDDRLCLWIDGSLVEFGEGTAYSRSGLSNNTPTDNDLTPVGIAVRGAAAVVSGLLVERDIYYRAQSNFLDTDPFWRSLTANLDRPAGWSEVYRNSSLDYDQLDLTIPPDHYLALGDNSPRSSDSRLWAPSQQTVPRDYLVGKAFFTYWPHAVPFLNDGKGYPVWYHKAFTIGRNGEQVVTVKEYPKYTLPFYPQVDRMRRIR
ncbi:MAG: signal peptidase I [Planctomycetaceae bacterium]|nr:signal peptidase I [Planctomycetaceae bacterium]